MTTQREPMSRFSLLSTLWAFLAHQMKSSAGPANIVACIDDDGRAIFGLFDEKGRVFWAGTLNRVAEAFPLLDAANHVLDGCNRCWLDLHARLDMH